MIEINSMAGNFLVKKEDIITIKYFHPTEIYVYIDTFDEKIKIKEDEYKRLKNILLEEDK